MRLSLCLFVFLGSLSVVLSGCETCGPDGELTVSVQFYRQNATVPTADSAIFSRVFSLNGGFSRTAVSPNQPLVLPLSVSADSTTYVFARPNRADTLTIFYKRAFLYQSTKCGYVLNVEEPVGHPLTKTTFPQGSGFLDRSWGLFNVPGPEVRGVVVNIML